MSEMELENKPLIECLVSLGRGQSPTYIEEESGTFAINQKCVRNGAVDAFHSRPHDQKIRVKDSALLQDGDVCINSTGTGTIGRVGLWSSKGLHNGTRYFADSHVTIARPNKETVNPKYLAALLESASVQTTMETYCFSGSTNQVELNRTALETLKISILGREAQNKVATILSTLDRAIEQTEAIIAKQQRLKAGLMQDLLIKGIDEHGVIRSEATHEFKDSPLGRIPVEWEVSHVGAYLINIGQGWSPDCESEPASIGEWGVLKTTAVTWEGYTSGENKRLPTNLKPRPQHEICCGDVLVTRAGPNSRVGVVSYVYSTEPKRMLSDKLYRLSPNDSLDGRFLVYSLSGFKSQIHLSTLKTGMAESQTNISQEIVRNMMTVLPVKQEQIRIADYLDKICRQSEQGLFNLVKLKKLKTGLMHDLLIGRVKTTPLPLRGEVIN